jgi:tetratricopeptide (TPR) repeat protein
MPNHEAGDTKPKRFRIAFSFAGEKREFVEKVASILADRFGEEKILYDKFHNSEFSRSDLAFYLPDLYEKESDLVVAVFCPDYDKKEWCGLEWNALFGLLKQRKVGEVMLTRFERVEGKGLRGLAGYTDLDDLIPEQAANEILERLALNEGKPKDHYARAARKRRPKSSVRTASASLLAIPHNLPRLSVFFGREKELKTIAEALSPKTRTWGVLIDGPGGMGKTSLAIRAAESVPTGAFQRILFLSSKERRMTAEGERKLSQFVVPGYLDMLNEIARQLGQLELAKQVETDRARSIIAALEPAHALLILDNIESLPKEQQNQLFEFLSQLPPGCKAIVTSRRRTDVDARIIRLGKLEKDAALALFAELEADQALLKKASETDRIHLYEETGGNPLLLRWMVGQLGRGSCRTLADALTLCRRAEKENNPLEFIFGDLLETFTDAETKALAALTYFTQILEVNHIAELAGLSKTTAQTALSDLANRALVVPDEEEKCFALVPMVADFLRHKRPEVVNETGDRLEKQAYALVVENGYDQHDRFHVLDAAWPTVAAALPRFLAGENERLQTVCDALFNFLNFTGQLDECLALSRDAESRAVAAGDFDKAGWRACQAGWVYYLREQSAEVLACADRAETHWREAHAGARERAYAIQLRGHGNYGAKNYPAAIAAYRESLELDRSLGRESRDVAAALNWLANAEGDSGDRDAAERDYREALRIARAIDYHEGIADLTGNLAALALDREDWLGGESLAREALPLSEKIGRLEVIAANRQRLALALVRQGKKEEALPHARRAVETYQKLGLPTLADAQKILAQCES